MDNGKYDVLDNTNNPDELKPCPFCGGEVRAFKVMRKPYDHGARCLNENCEATISRCASEWQAIEAWNTRPPTTEEIEAEFYAASVKIMEGEDNG